MKTHKNIRWYLLSVYKTLTCNEDSFIIALFSIAGGIILFGLNGHIVTFTILLTIIGFILLLKTKDLTISSFLVMLYSLQFYTPFKSYKVEVLRSIDIKTIPNFPGKFFDYGLHLSNIFIFLACVAVLRDIFLHHRRISLSVIRFLSPFLISYLLFFIFSLIVSLNYSPYLALSVVWLVQYMQIIVVASLFFFVYIFHKSKFNLIYPVLLAFVLFQSVLGLRQFNRQSFLGLSIEGYNTLPFEDVAIDTNNALFRIPGTFLFHSEFAFIILMTSVVFLPKALRHKQSIYLLGILGAIITIILTQTRSIWIATFLISSYTLIKYKNSIRQLITKFGILRLKIYSSILLIILSFIIIPRIEYSFNYIYVGGGGPFRSELLYEGFQSFLQNPFLGYGIGPNVNVLFKFFPNGITSTSPSNIHFAPLQLAIETGIIGVIFFLFPFFYILRKSFSKKIQQKNFFHQDTIFIFFMGCIASIFFYLFTPHHGTIEFAYLGIILGFGIIHLYITKNV